jgi:cell division protein FtsI/penicillin-binding protein 2
MSTEEANKINLKRMNVLAFCLTFGFAVVIARLAQYQIVNFAELKDATIKQRIYVKEIQPIRGDITDYSGHVLAQNMIRWDISVSPSLVTKRHEAQVELVDELANLLNLPKEVVSNTIESEQPWLRLGTHVDYEVGEAIRDLERYGGITCEPRLYRYYPERGLFGPVVGFVNDPGDGSYGVEGYYDTLLRGHVGVREVEQNPVGEELPIPRLREQPAIDGSDLRLTLDRNIQHIAEQELRGALERFGAGSGIVLIADPKTGAVLASVSYPTYDPNDYIDTDPSLFPDPAVSKVWEPGSIFKIITWAAALDSGVISPGTTVHDEGAREVGGRVIRNWDRKAYGLVTMRDGLVHSLNTVAAFVSTSLGKDRFYTYLRRFGFGMLTDVGLDMEGPGVMKLPGDSDWFPSELGTNSFGQGIAVTPMQMIAAVSAVANKGMMMQPHVLHQYTMEDTEGGGQRTVQVEPQAVRRVVSQQTAETLTGMLVEVIEKGATKAQVPGYRVAGKTGTAQIPTAYGYHPTDTIASFVGFAPADDPQFIILIRLDRPTASPWGSQTAAPTFRAIAERLLVYLQLPPDELRLAQR